MTLFLPALDELMRFFLLMVRLGAVVLTLPLLGSRTVPSQLKILFVLLLSLGLYPVVQAQHVVIPQSLGLLVLFVLGEAFVGMMIGFVGQILFVGVQLGGELISYQMGLSLATLFDPQNAVSSSLVTNFQYVLAVLIFFSLFAHHWFIVALAESLHMVPLLGFTISKAATMSLVTLLGKAFVVAIKLDAPIIVTLILVAIGMGIMARLVPQLNIFILSFPVNLGTGLLMLSLSLFYVLQVMRLLFGQLPRDLSLIIRLLGDG